MARHFRTESAHRRFRAELARKADQLRQQYGPAIDWEKLQQLLKDPQFAPCPCEVRFDASQLLPGEFGHTVTPALKGDRDCIIYLHPKYSTQLARVPYLVLYQLALINYGALATADDAETFGALALGISRAAYFQALCELSGQLGDERP